MKRIPKGIYPVMITPYTDNNKIDFDAVDHLVDFYAENGCQGIFAVCQSSEMWYLDEDERVELASRVVKASNGRMCIVASGHISDSIDNQIKELKRISETGVDAVVMVSNRLAAKDEDDEVLISNMWKILNSLPNVTFGMYECPYPYKRLLTDKVLEAMALSGRFSFIKDTCCDADLIAHRVKVLNGRIQLFNANCTTMLDTLKAGADGFSGLMANFVPDILVWLATHYIDQPEKAQQVASILSLLSCVEGHSYPINAKYHMNLVGVPMKLHSRSRDERDFNTINHHEMHDFINVEQLVRSFL